jgi:hypothetical protein
VIYAHWYAHHPSTVIHKAAPVRDGAGGPLFAKCRRCRRGFRSGLAAACGVGAATAYIACQLIVEHKFFMHTFIRRRLEERQVDPGTVTGVREYQAGGIDPRDFYRRHMKTGVPRRDSDVPPG